MTSARRKSLHPLDYVSSALRLMYSKIAKAAMHEIPWNAKPTFSSASVISDTLYADKIDYFFYSSRSGLTPRVRAITQCLPTGCRCIFFMRSDIQTIMQCLPTGCRCIFLTRSDNLDIG